MPQVSLLLASTSPQTRHDKAESFHTRCQLFFVIIYQQAANSMITRLDLVSFVGKILTRKFYLIVLNKLLLYYFIHLIIKNRDKYFDLPLSLSKI